MARSSSADYLTAPALEEIEQLAAHALRTLPPPLRAHCRDVIIKVLDFPDDETIEQLELETPFDILGLYTGVDLPARSISDVGRLPDIVQLYRRPILDYWCESGETLGHIVRHVLIHEIGHHFGLSDEDMERLEENAED
jgi:predicted Zn-dependent protease with MMP-like domain